MNIPEYVERLKALNPTREELIKRTISAELIEIWPNTFSLTPKKTSTATDDENPIMHIVENYDTSNFNVFGLRFLEDIQPVQQYLLFGEDEADSLAIHKTSGEIFLILYSDLLIPLGIEEGDEEEISYITPVAKDQTSFLEALYIAVELSSLVHKGKVSWQEDTAIKKEYGQRCVQKAGGEKYEYWYGFLGC